MLICYNAYWEKSLQRGFTCKQGLTVMIGASKQKVRLHMHATLFSVQFFRIILNNFPRCLPSLLWSILCKFITYKLIKCRLMATKEKYQRDSYSTTHYICFHQLYVWLPYIKSWLVWWAPLFYFVWYFHWWKLMTFACSLCFSIQVNITDIHAGELYMMEDDPGQDTNIYSDFDHSLVMRKMGSLSQVSLSLL